MPPPRDTQRIAKLLARAGIASRREVERMIAEGRIAIDGKTVETPATLLASLHGVTVDGKPVKAAAPARLFRYHKPAGLLTTERDPKGRPTIYDRLPRDLPRLMPVGRLDMNTEGLLLLTTDGELKRQLELPATGVERSYRARAFGTVTQERLEELIEGIEIEGVRYGPIDANLERRTGRNQWIELRLREGKNREVRRVLEHLGLQVSRLIRTAYGPFALDDLPAGAVDEVRQHDVVAFRKWLSAPGGGTTAFAPRSRAAAPGDSSRPSPSRSSGGTTAFAPRSRAPAPGGASRPSPSRTSPVGPAAARRGASPGTRRDERRGPNPDAERRPARTGAKPGPKRRDSAPAAGTPGDRRPRRGPEAAGSDARRPARPPRKPGPGRK